MSSYLKETIEAKRIQCGTGAASATAETLDGALDNRKACKGVTVKNDDASIILYVGKEGVTAATGYALKAGESIKLEVEDPWNVYVLAASGTPAYSWMAI